jgi:hypothetical protein
MRPGSPTAVVLRQGPSKLFASIGWDLQTDTFAIGQWCKHKLYPRRCDISEDGQWLRYFALNGRWKSATQGAWAAISRAPYLRAVQLFPIGDTWGGHGQFGAGRVDPTNPAASITLGLYETKLERDGWHPVDSAPATRATSFTKELSGGWRLHKFLTNREAEESHALEPPGAPRLERPTWLWADVDTPRQRLVWSEHGKIFAAALTQDGPAEPRPLFDSGGMTFQAIKAPYDDR